MGKKVVLLEDNPGMTEDHYWEIVKKIGIVKNLPDGCHAHNSSVSPDGHFRVISVWDDNEAMEKFHQEVLHEERAEHITANVKRQIWELSNMVVTDHKDQVVQRVSK